MNFSIYIVFLLVLSLVTGCTTVSQSAINPLADPIRYQIQAPADVQKPLATELSIQRKNLQSEQFQQPIKLAFSEKQVLQKKLQSLGYWGAAIEFSLEEDTLVYRVNPGPRFQIASVSLNAPDQVPVKDFTGLPLKPGAPLLAKDVLAARAAVREWLVQTQCLDKIRVTYRVIMSPDSPSAAVVFDIADSPQLTFGELQIEGLTTLDEAYLRQRLPFSQGDCFKRGALDRSRILLLQTGLIASVVIEELPIKDKTRPLKLVVAERAHRSVTLGAGFETEEGFGVAAGWEHRNILGRGEKLSAELYLAENAQRLSSNMTLPYRGRNDQTITFYGGAAKEDFDAYESRIGTAGAEISRQLTPHLRAMAGGEVSFSEITEDGDTENYALLSAPLGLELDYRDAPLDPTRGWQGALNIRPYWDAYDTGTRFIRASVTAAAYHTLSSLPARPTFAVRSAIGSITGIGRDEVPANIRFYSGGGGSVRGYGFQMLGPLDEEDEPDGGLSYFEVSMETRLRWGENWGGVLFLDGGTAYENRHPTFNQSLRWGAGMGLRFYTSFAPIRLDLAVPLDKREGIDDDFQIYVSIGQAF